MTGSPGERARLHPLRRREDFQRVYRTGRRAEGPLLGIRVAPNGGDLVRVGFAVSRRAFGNAVVRNRVRRRLREALRAELAHIRPGVDLVVTPRRGAVEAGFTALREALVQQLRRAGAIRAAAAGADGQMAGNHHFMRGGRI